MNNIMNNMINNMIIIKILLFISGLGIILHNYGNKLTIVEGYTIGVIITTISIILFNNLQKKKNLLYKNHKVLFKFIGLLVAFVGCIIWFMGEYLVFRGFEDKPIIDTIGAFACSIAALITLIIYIEER